MEINATAVKDLRLERGWTQQHLADACALSLRTVQRIEKDGIAAGETVQALCAVFDVEVRTLSVVPDLSDTEARPLSLTGHRVAHLAGFLLGIGLGAVGMFFWLHA